MGALVAIILCGGMYVFVQWYQSPEVQEQENNEELVSPTQNNAEKPEPVISSGAKNIPLPSGYKELDRSHATYTSDQDAKQVIAMDERIEIIAEAPTSVWAWIELGGIKYGFKDYRGAEEAWLHATKLAPTHTPAYANLAELYWRRLKDYPKAEVMMKKVLEIDQTYVAMYRNLSDLYRYEYAAKSVLADDILKDGIAKLPTEHDLLAHLAYYYVDMEDWANAVVYLEKLSMVRKGDEQITNDLSSARKKLAGQ